MDTLDRNEVLKKIDEVIKHQEITLVIINKFLEVVKKMDGKQISKRIATALEKEFPEYKVIWDTRYGMYHIDIWGNGIEYKDEIRIMIGYDTGDGHIHYDQILDFNGCYTLDKERREQLIAFKEEIDNHIEVYQKYLKVKEYTKKYFDSFEYLYPISEIFKI